MRDRGTARVRHPSAFHAFLTNPILNEAVEVAIDHRARPLRLVMPWENAVESRPPSGDRTCGNRRV